MRLLKKISSILSIRVFGGAIILKTKARVTECIITSKIITPWTPPYSYTAPSPFSSYLHGYQTKGYPPPIHLKLWGAQPKPVPSAVLFVGDCYFYKNQKTLWLDHIITVILLFFCYHHHYLHIKKCTILQENEKIFLVQYK